MYSLMRKTLFHLDPEQAHDLIISQLKRLSGTPLECLIRQSLSAKPVNCMGLSFKNPLGLAAGLDKDGECIDALGAMGFGFIEIGTVTPRPQSGNDKPRLFRLPEAGGLINRMGFNSAGVDEVIRNIKKSRFNGVLGVNIGKNASTPLEQGKEDYLLCMDKIYPHAGYIALNISSPNTSDLRVLQYGDLLDDLLTAVKDRQGQLQQKYNNYVPVAVKIAPDIRDADLVQIADSLVRHHIDAVIATNTTVDRRLVQGLHDGDQTGGLSGRPLQMHSTAVINRLSQELRGRLPVIGVGGIDSLIAAREKMLAGASLIQVYSALIFRGPGLLKEIINHI